VRCEGKALQRCMWRLETHHRYPISVTIESLRCSSMYQTVGRSTRCSTCGRERYLINNAGIMTYTDVITVSSSDLAADMDVNSYGSLRVTQAFLPLIEKKEGGAIVNIHIIASTSLSGM
jgi:short-subunit dehydrogenase